tara:strand:+ start:274 stop:528 length:255 start_codon:yes stop_codon:yes gene_type:complete
MKTLKSIQKNQVQLNSLLMEKWGYNNVLAEEAIEEEEDLSGVVMNPGEGATLEEAQDHPGRSCKKAHPDMSHEEWEAEETKEEK